MESEKNWYVIHTYSGYEKKVKDNLERKVRSMGLENVIEAADRLRDEPLIFAIVGQGGGKARLGKTYGKT